MLLCRTCPVLLAQVCCRHIFTRLLLSRHKKARTRRRYCAALTQSCARRPVSDPVPSTSALPASLLHVWQVRIYDEVIRNGEVKFIVCPFWP